MFEETIYA